MRSLEAARPPAPSLSPTLTGGALVPLRVRGLHDHDQNWAASMTALDCQLAILELALEVT